MYCPYDAATNRLTMSESDGTITTWTYDAVNQLLSEYRTGGPTTGYNVTHAYDPAGNRTIQNSTGVLTTFTYSNANRLLQMNTSGGVTTYTVDGAGNQTSAISSVDSNYYTWDATGQMSSAEVAAGTVSFNYNADGQRTAKASTDSTATGYLYDYKNLLAETDEVGGDISTLYTTTTDQEFGDLIDENSSPQTPLADAQANTNAIVGPDGSVLASYKYNAFGSVAAVSIEGDAWASLTVDQWATMSVDQWAELPVDLSPQAVTGFGGTRQYYLDSETNLLLLGGGTNGRYTPPGILRFTSDDPIRQASGTDNLQQYGRNDPVSNHDASGHGDPYVYYTLNGPEIQNPITGGYDPAPVHGPPPFVWADTSEKTQANIDTATDYWSQVEKATTGNIQARADMRKVELDYWASQNDYRSAIDAQQLADAPAREAARAHAENEAMRRQMWESDHKGVPYDPGSDPGYFLNYVLGTAYNFGSTVAEGIGGVVSDPGGTYSNAVDAAAAFESRGMISRQDSSTWNQNLWGLGEGASYIFGGIVGYKPALEVGYNVNIDTQQFIDPTGGWNVDRTSMAFGAAGQIILGATDLSAGFNSELSSFKYYSPDDVWRAGLGAISVPRTTSEQYSTGLPESVTRNGWIYEDNAAQIGQQTVDDVLTNDFQNLKQTVPFKYDNNFLRAGGAKPGRPFNRIGPIAFNSLQDLRDTIIEEELHQRWFKRGIFDDIHSNFEQDSRFYKTIERYKRMRQWPRTEYQDMWLQRQQQLPR